MSIVMDRPSGLRARFRNLARAGFVTLALTCASCLLMCVYDDVARVGAVEVHGNAEVSDVALRHLADVQVGESLALVDLADVVAGVDRHPWIAEATVYRAWPDRVVIEVREHEDVLLLAHRGLYRVNAEGELFVRARSGDLDRPVLTGLSPALVDEHPGVARRIVRDALAVHGAVRDCAVLAEDDLSEIHFDAALGFTLRLRNNSAIHLGFQPPHEPLARLERMVGAGLDLNHVLEIDLDLNGLAVATPLDPTSAS